MNYEVAIPSYHRVNCLKTKTLPLLKRGGVPVELITLFVNGETEAEAYRQGLTAGTYNRIEVSPPGIGATRNFIEFYYPVGTRVMCFDDDLSDIVKKADYRKLTPVKNIVTELIEYGFAACEKYRAFLFGVYNVPDAYFMRKKITLDLCYTSASAFGFIARHDPDLMVTLDDKEDFERAILYYLKDGRIVRLDNITLITKFYKEPGGLQDTRTEKRIYDSALTLAKRYPWLCTMYIRKSTGHAELRMRDKVRPRR